MYILFIVTSFWAYGELLIAVEFAKRAYKAGYKPIFLIPPSHKKIIQNHPFKHTMLIPGSGKINRILLQDIEHCYAPKLVILADFLNYHFCERHYGLLPKDLEIFSGKIGTFDDFSWDLTSNRMDTYGFHAKGYGELSLDDYSFYLSPCPLNHPKSDITSKQFCYAHHDNLTWCDEVKKREARKALDIPLDKKVILLTIATWQHTHVAYPQVENFVNISNKMLEHILLQLGDDTFIICVGPEMIFTTNKPTNYRAYKQLQPADFEVCLFASDLFLSSNITSATLAKATLSGIPAIVFFSSVYKQDDKIKQLSNPAFQITPFAQTLFEQVEYCYPFRMFPVGWYDFLTPLVHNNLFCNTLMQVELFDEKGCLEAITDILYNQNVYNQLTLSSKNYLTELEKLPEVNQILEILTQ